MVLSTAKAWRFGYGVVGTMEIAWRHRGGVVGTMEMACRQRDGVVESTAKAWRHGSRGSSQAWMWWRHGAEVTSGRPGRGDDGRGNEQGRALPRDRPLGAAGENRLARRVTVFHRGETGGTRNADDVAAAGPHRT